LTLLLKGISIRVPTHPLTYKEQIVAVDVRNAKNIEAIKEHKNTVTSKFYFQFSELREATEGSYFQFFDECFVEAGVEIEPHKHNSHEFYYILEGIGIMRVGKDSKEVGPADLVHVPANEPHSIKGGPAGVKFLAFAASFQKEGEGHIPV
jgi:mannose-6-phosphate isomerase-like protein (cupin superfamily)